MNIGYQGINGSFSSIVARKMFPNMNYISFKTFADVLEAIENGKIDCGILPIENSYAGRVAGMHNLFRDFCNRKLFIVAEKLLKIEHCICSIQNTDIGDITHVFSHEQAIMQCQKNIHKILPNAVISPKENTAIAAKFVAENNNKHFCAICSIDACKQYQLKILHKNFQDEDDNYTLFVGISKQENIITKETKNVLTSILFEIKNAPGSLFNALKCFRDQKIDLVKIESYIPTIKSQQAMFFTTIKGNVREETYL